MLKDLVIIMFVIFAIGCAPEGKPPHLTQKSVVKSEEAYQSCMDSGPSSGMRRQIENNKIYAKEIKEDAKECIRNISNTVDGIEKDEIEACSDYAFNINGGINPKVSVWKSHFAYADVLKSVNYCESLR